MSNLITGDFPVHAYRNINTGATGALIKAAAGQIFNLNLSNSGAAFAYVKLYDKVTAGLSTDTPTHTIGLPATSSVNVSVGQGIQFLHGISVRATTGVADADVTSPGANEVVVNIHWL